MEGWIVAASVITALAGLTASGAAIWLAVLNRQLVTASQIQVAASQEQVTASQKQVAVGQEQVKVSQEQVTVSQDEVRASQEQVAAIKAQTTVSQEQIKISQEQVAASRDQLTVSQEQLDSQQRPLLIPVGTPIFHQDQDNWLKWEANEQPITLRNLGTGTAFNSVSVLYGCTAYLHDTPTGPTLVPSMHNPHWSRWLGVPLAPGEQEDRSLTLGASTFLQGNDHIGGYSFKAPEEPGMMAMATQGALWRVARLTTTYHDISGRKYASIFDYIRNLGWYKVDVLRDIERDLLDMEGYYRSVPAQETPEDQTTDQAQ